MKPCTHPYRPIDSGKLPLTPGTRAYEKWGPWFYWHRTDTFCIQGGGRTRCMDWHDKYHASSPPCRDPENCGCRPLTPRRQAWASSTNLC